MGLGGGLVAWLNALPRVGCASPPLPYLIESTDWKHCNGTENHHKGNKEQMCGADTHLSLRYCDYFSLFVFCHVFIAYGLFYNIVIIPGGKHIKKTQICSNDS